MNIKFIICVFLLSLPTLNVKAQEIDVNGLNFIKINNLSSLSSIDQLKEAFENKRIVLLGEQTHGEGSTFDAKIALVKYLHNELGFNLIAFESGFYSNYKAGEINKSQNPDPNAFYESVFDIWSDSKQFEELVNFIKQTHDTENPLNFMGFDFQEGLLFKEFFFDDLIKVLYENNLQLQDSTLDILKDTFFGDVNYISTNYQDSLRFYSAVQTIEEAFKKVKPTEHSKILHQSFKSFLSYINWAVDIYISKEYKVQNPRDDQMAKNLIFLANLYPDKKIIGWGASYHFANQIQNHENTDITRKYMQDMLKEDEKAEPENLDSLLNGAIPMGKILKEYFREELYSLAFSSYEGTFGLIGSEPAALLTPPSGSIENALAQKGYDFAFVDYPDNLKGSFYSSPLGNLPVLAPWQDIFDGLFFVRLSYPPEFSQYAELNLNTVNKKINASITGKVIDAKTKQPVPYVHITILNTPKGTVSNDEGSFKINITESGEKNILVFSSVGYKRHEVDINNNADLVMIELVPEVTLLNEIIVSDKSLSAKQIIKKAQQSIEANYYQQAYNQELFYRVQKKSNDTITFNEEASILVYDKSGYRPSNLAYKDFYGQILQFRNTTENPEKNKWDGVGSLWLIFSHDLILGEDNVLHRTSAYDLEITNILPYDGKMVYEIKFKNKRPSSYTTGYGYPAPDASHGRLYIDTQSYVVLRYEHCIERKDSDIKKDSEFQYINNRIQLIQTYSKLNNGYFLTLSKQIMSGTRINLDSKENTELFKSYTLLSTDIETDQVKIIDKPLEKLKVGMKVKEDKEFWQRHNYLMEENNKDLNICEK